MREVGEKTAAARDVKSFWPQVLDGLSYNAYDAPFVLLYSVNEETDSDESSVQSTSMLSTRQCMLEGSLGVPEGHKSAPAQVDLKSGTEGFAPAFRDAMRNEMPILLQLDDGTLSEDLLTGIDWRGFGDPCRAAVVSPIHPTTGESVLGFLVMGINPRRPYDDDYSLFVHLLGRQLATSMASVVLFEEEIQRGQRAAQLAAQDRIELSNQLAIRTQEAVESENKFTRMAEFAPVGMFIASSRGEVNYCNDTWYEISHVPKENVAGGRWMSFIKEEDREMMTNKWDDLIHQKIPLSAEFRFKEPWIDRNGAKGDRWVLASAYPEQNKDGNLQSVFGSITNISQQKWAEDVQKRRMEDAVELKRQQENFIDITSHEMRNPLSAILQCADEVQSSLKDYKKRSTVEPELQDLMDSNIDAAEVISLCAQHQKRIVDDILTLSKLDSARLLVTPVDYQPITVIQRLLKIVEGEVQKTEISLEFRVDDSYKTLSIDWVRLDPSRLLQVLINLTGNAIKFTTTREKRSIVITLSASKDQPSKEERAAVAYFEARSNRPDPTMSEDWGTGEQLFLHFSVQDTGRGITAEEQNMLFQRFAQASPRTHVQYGGSGLGLFISKELVELQGGQIGVSSESGKGSIFAFYVKARRSTAPAEAVDNVTSLPKKAKAGANKLKSPSSGKSGPSDASASQRTSSTTAVIDPHHLSLLVVEDNLVNQRVLTKQLKKLGFGISLANHGGEAIEKLKSSMYWKGNERTGIPLDVVLMDQEMPVMDGLTCTKKIRELQAEGSLVGHVPIIAVTANARGEQIQTALAAGMVGRNHHLL